MSVSEGRKLYSFFPDVTERINNDSIEPDYVTSQMFTVHGCYSKRLNDKKLNDRKDCDCGWNEETRDQVLWYCLLYDDERKEMLGMLERTMISVVHFANLTSTKENFTAFREFCKRWHDKRMLLKCLGSATQCLVSKKAIVFSNLCTPIDASSLVGPLNSGITTTMSSAVGSLLLPTSRSSAACVGSVSRSSGQGISGTVTRR
ncbi:Retrovirus-related Pol polyprotein from type-1 retrotransposable element R1 4 [Eumeta japonica]|uniref:Retrovirus-related Pol polyprotein from type-1 retrotransposable element R1 4 n=1 Tax=Eumeta variegata TaxID=151549 RepID=A0A4C1XT88_EUMVA|nr:Retrovirus-related Pol polyprotein from type-1 retrotransposable element R1 4 [Eumeta japonica]